MNKYLFVSLITTYINLYKMCIYSHDICHNIESNININNKNICVGLFVFNEENDKMTIMFNNNNYENHVPDDNNCYLETLKRKAKDLKFIFGSWDKLYDATKRSNSQLRCFIFNNIIVFVAKCLKNKYNIKRLQYNARLFMHNVKSSWQNNKSSNTTTINICPNISFVKQLENWKYNETNVNDNFTSFVQNSAFSGLILLQQDGFFENYLR